MGEPNLNIFRFLKTVYEINTFVESGSGHGTTVSKAIEIFPAVHTVELSDSLFQEVNKKYGKVAKCYHGKSSDILRTILPPFHAPILYWLDAHWSRDQTAGKDNQCPLLSELEEINKRPGNQDFIFIDDAHLFFSPCVLKAPYDVRTWPNINQVFEKLNKKERYNVILSSWRCSKHNHPQGIVFPEDVIISVPEHAKDKFYNYLMNIQLEGN
jgi:hypothetical protein